VMGVRPLAKPAKGQSLLRTGQTSDTSVQLRHQSLPPGNVRTRQIELRPFVLFNFFYINNKINKLLLNIFNNKISHNKINNIYIKNLIR
jgi:hypothetical protein